DLEQWLRGDYAVSGITLNWFFALRIVAVPLVLCGGGARGVMEVGFYQALVKLQIPINKMIGSWVGRPTVTAGRLKCRSGYPSFESTGNAWSSQ
ncbi:MAG: hypothetical protein KGQ68_08145, partial [Gammaproteobacteria bacterium]|nr:hypothetical protein [Gammaproteobacteria bacterium]